jgi:DNA-binding PadR family transcriptional regulator
MKFRMHGCGPRGFGPIPEAILAMGTGGRGWGGGPWDWGADFGGPRHRGGGRRRMFEAGELRLVLLRLIAAQPRHGYDLIRAIEELTHGTYAPSPGVVYPTLTMLQDMGLIRENETEGSRKVFAVTPDGEAYLADRKEEIDGLMSRLEGFGEDKRKAGGAPIKRAVGNLLSALWHRATREDMDEDRLHEIAAILDEAAQRIERLK